MALWHNYQDASGWHWQSLRGALSSDASAVSWSSGRIDVFARGLGGALWHQWFDQGTWHHWESLGGQLAAQPAAVSLSPGRLDVFVWGTDNGLWDKRYDASGWHWVQLGGQISSQPSATTSGSNRLDVFARGADGALWHDAFDGTAWSWEPRGGRLAAAPAAISPAPGQLMVFVRGRDGALWRDSFVGSWQWEGLGGQVVDSPAAVLPGDAFVEGADGKLWHWQASGWESLGGQLAAPPAVVVPAPGEVSVFAQWSDRTLRYLHRSAVWDGWQNHGGVLLSASDPLTFPIPVYLQVMNLDCETAALQMALSALGHSYTQSQLFALEQPDTRPPVMGSDGHVLRWGDPYTNFVGDVNGTDHPPPTGYGIYFPLIASIASSHGAPYASGGEGFSAASVYDAVAAGHPVEVWVEVGWSRPYIGTWTAWDGRAIRYSLNEHTVILSGISPTSVRVNDPWHGTQYWVSKATFETSWSDFHNMAIIF
jgi:uncharacterized protein YvpB